MEVHVIPVAKTGRWLVHPTQTSAPQSEHDTETAAEAAARAWARRRIGTRVVIHDRYHRTRELTLAGADRRAG